jgi:hypothetical protein
VRGRREQRVQREGGHREPALHVAGAAAVQPIPIAAGFERGSGPDVGLVRRDDVDVPVEQERRTISGAEPADHVGAALVGGLWHAGERIVPDLLGDGQPFDLEAEAFQLVLDDVLCLVLPPDRAGSRDETLEERERGPGAFGDRLVEPLDVQTRPRMSFEWSNV